MYLISGDSCNAIHVHVIDRNYFVRVAIEKIPHHQSVYTDESAYFEVIRIKRGLQIIRIRRERDFSKNVDGRSRMLCQCAGG